MYRIGVDLGGTNIATGVIDENYKIIGRGKVKTNAPRKTITYKNPISTREL